MLGYLLSLSLPVFIYFISYLSVVFIQTFYQVRKGVIFRYLIILILVTIFLEFLYRRNNKLLVWIIVFSPFLLFGILIILFLYMFLFLKRKNETYSDRLKLIQNVFSVAKKLSNINIFNQLKTFININ